MPTILTALVFLQITTPLFAIPSEGAQAVLQQVASTCRELYKHGYVVEVTRHEFTRPHFSTGTGADVRQGMPAPLVPGSNSGAVDHVLLARSGKKFRFDVRNSAKEVWEWITDGETLWCYRRDLNEYTETKTDPWPERLGPGPGLPGTEWKYFAKFLAIGDVDGQTIIVQADAPADSTCAGPSVVLDLDLGSGGMPAGEILQHKEELRVLTGSHLPCRSTTHEVFRIKGQMLDRTESITWKFREQAPDPSMFVFAPRPAAKQVKRFSRR